MKEAVGRCCYAIAGNPATGADGSMASTCLVAVPLRALHALIAAPSVLFLATLTLMLFRPPNVGLWPCDRIAFILLVFVVGLRWLLLRGQSPLVLSIAAPMAALLLLVLAGNWAQPFSTEDWSLVAAKFLVPFAMFHLARLVFTSELALRQLEIFCILALVYLCFISIAFLAGAKQLIFPRFILDSGVEMHADRARGPFLQAVANGTTLNMLGLIALQVYRRRRLPLMVAVAVLLSLPLAIFATMTRSVWLSFAVSAAVAAYLAVRGRIRRTAGYFTSVALLMLAGASTVASGQRSAFEERFNDRETVDFRIAIYQLSWDMVRERPLVGWGQGQFAREIETRISDFRPGMYAAHNTFIEVLVEHGFLGIALYSWIGVSMLRLTRKANWLSFTWPILLGVYWVNASFVVMNYQFVNVLVFTFAGVLSYQQAVSHRAPVPLLKAQPQ